MIYSVKAEVHLVIRKRKIELFLRLAQRIRVSRWRATPNFLRNAQVFSKLIDLRLIKMGDGLEIRRPIAIFHKETLVVFKTIGSPRNRVIQSIGMMVFDHLAHALLKVAGGNHSKIRLC